MMEIISQARFIRRGVVLLIIGLGLGSIAGGCGEQTTPETENEEMPEYAEQMKGMMEQRRGQ